MRWQTWPAASAGAKFRSPSNDKPDAVTQLSGSIARAPFAAGEPIREAKLIKGQGVGLHGRDPADRHARGRRPKSTPETGAGGFILPNDHVDVILSRRDREAEKAAGVEMHSSETILTNVRVLAIDQTVEEKNGQTVVIGKTATLELTPRQAETLALSRNMGTLSLALRSLVDASGDRSDTDEDERRPAQRRQHGALRRHHDDDAEMNGKDEGT